MRPGASAYDSRRPRRPTLQKIVPHLWYVDQAVEAAQFYASVFPDSSVDRVSQIPSDSPSGPAGTVDVVEFTLFGQAFMAISAGPLDDFNHRVSFIVKCDSQDEVDRYWNALVEGGTPEACGWLRDRYGLSWQITPTVLGEMMNDPDPARAKRVSDAVLTMVKIDLAALQAVYDEP